jgi:hypothetical protein
MMRFLCSSVRITCVRDHRGRAASRNLLLLLALDDSPALILGNRAMFFDPDDIADRVFVLLVMRVIVLRTTDRLFHRRVSEPTLNAYDNGLILLVADDGSLQLTLRHRDLYSFFADVADLPFDAFFD